MKMIPIWFLNWVNGRLFQDWYNSDLELQIDPTNFCSARARSDGGFAHLWAGAKATSGATTGKVSSGSCEKNFELSFA